jgi:exopolysaccharide biosynthesis polyprenyl glycosylphosphotransferase
MIRNTKEPILLFLGDVALFYGALWATLVIRYTDITAGSVWALHVGPFSILFTVWVVVFYIAGLYGKHTLVLKRRLPTRILKTQLFNIALAVSFFYFIAFFGITPKTNLFIYLVISSLAILLWRLYGQELLGVRRRQKAILIGSGKELSELRDELLHNDRYHLDPTLWIDLDDVEGLDFEKDVLEPMYSEGIAVAVVSMHNKKIEPILPRFYNLMFAGVRFIDMHKVYEDIFDRVPLSVLRHSWFLENISLSPRRTYDTLKRFLDLAFAFGVGIVTLPIYPVVWLAVKLDDRGSLFITQERIGENNHPIRIFKFRTMTGNDDGNYGPSGKTSLQVTRIGTWLRLLRVDELPQLWNVLKGDLSFVGPRPELPQLAAEYDKQVPYYHIRHLVKPGLSGWAQIHHERHPHHGADVEETKVKLSYDLSYIKNRSLSLDLEIMLKTLRILVSRSGL